MKKTHLGFTLIELMIVVAIIGILASIALPAYQGYVIRSKLTEGFTIAGGFKAGVSEAFTGDGEIGVNNYATIVATEMGLGSIATPRISSVVIGTAAASRGNIVISYNTNNATGGIAALAGVNTIVYSPSINGAAISDTNASGTIHWVCAGAGGVKAAISYAGRQLGTVPDIHLPSECK